MQISFKGSGSMSDNIEGIARISSALLNEGTKKLGSTKFATKLENRAINLSSSAGTETFGIDMSSLKEEFANTIKYAKELLSDPNYTEETLAKIKMITVGKIKQKETDFDYIASQNLRGELFKSTPLSHPFEGTLKSIEKITLQDIETFIDTSLALSRAIVVVGGDISIEEVQNYLQKIFTPLKAGKPVEIKNHSVSKKAKDKTVHKQTQQAYIYFGAPYDLTVSSSDAYKSKVATFILGSGGFGSRLMEEIRVKRGLAYSAYCRVHLSNSSNYFTGYLQTKLESQEEAIKVVKEEIERFVSKGVTKEELQKAKQFLLGSEPLRVETLSQRLGRTFNEYYQGLGFGHAQKELELIEALTLDQINYFIANHKEITKLTFSIVNKKE
jgi:predicted Zn-dependent peptidase